MMEETTLKDKQLVNLLNDHFYLVFFNPEKEAIPEKLITICKYTQKYILQAFSSTLILNF